PTGKLPRRQAHPWCANRGEPAMFKTTAWTLLDQAAGDDNNPEVKRAREEIWLRYYDSSHEFFRRRLGDPDKADDYSHSFWLGLWKNWEPLKGLSRGKGR